MSLLAYTNQSSGLVFELTGVPSFSLLQEGDPTPKAPKPGSVAPAAMTGDATGLGIGVYAFVLIGGAAAYFAYNYLQAQQQAQQGA